MSHAPRHPDGLLRAKELATPGLCIFCETAIPRGRPGRPPSICGSADCLRAYDTARWRDKRLARPTARTLWFCGCGKRLDRGQHGRRGCLFAVDRWPIIIVPARVAA